MHCFEVLINTFTSFSKKKKKKKEINTFTYVYLDWQLVRNYKLKRDKKLMIALTKYELHKICTWQFSS